MSATSPIKVYTTTRTFMEWGVGDSHSVEVVVYLRRQDMNWWNSDVTRHHNDLMKIIGRQVVPKEFPQVVTTAAGDERYKSVIGENNKKLCIDQTKGKGPKKNKQAQNVPGRRRKRGKDEVAGTVSKKGKSDDQDKSSSVVKGTTKKKCVESNVTMLFGDFIQVTYKMEEINTSSSATLLFDCSSSSSSSDEDGDTTRSKDHQVPVQGSKAKNSATKNVKFHQLKKLPKRVVLWCFRFDPDFPTAPNPVDGGGFPRPELVPITSFFRRPKDE